MMTNVDHEGQVFLSHPYMNNGFFFLLPIKFCFSYLKKKKKKKKKTKKKKHEKGFTEVPEYTEMQHTYDMVTSLKQFNDITEWRAAVHVFFPTGWYGVCEIECSHMGKYSGNPDLVCKKLIYYMSRLCTEY